MFGKLNLRVCTFKSNIYSKLPSSDPYLCATHSCFQSHCHVNVVLSKLNWIQYVYNYANCVPWRSELFSDLPMLMLKLIEPDWPVKSPSLLHLLYYDVHVLALTKTTYYLTLKT